MDSVTQQHSGGSIAEHKAEAATTYNPQENDSRLTFSNEHAHQRPGTGLKIETRSLLEIQTQ